jgi:hypothetical protein
VHRGGNRLSYLAYLVRGGAALIETDVRMQSGELVVAPERWLGPLAYDWSRKLLRLGDRPFRLTRLLAETKRLDARLLLDLKLDPAWAPALVGRLRQHDMLHDTAFTGEWRILDAIAESGVAHQGLYYGSINRPGRLQRFLNQQPRLHRPGVSLRKSLASPRNIARLHASGARVLVYVVSEAEEALANLQAGADGLITNNLDLALVWVRDDALASSDADPTP